MAGMRTFAAVTLVTLLAFAHASSNGIASRGPVSVSDLAPADEYFGHQHWSPLGIRHKIFSLKDDLHHARSQPDAIQRDAQAAEDALTDWMTRFPRDPWLPATAWNLATLYEELPGTDAQTHAIAMLHAVQAHYAGTPYADYATHDLSRGVGVRPWPHWAVAAAPTTAPTATPSSGLPADPQSLVEAVLAQTSADGVADPKGVQTLENRYWVLSRGGADPAYARAAWELAAAYQRLTGDDARAHSIRLLALLVDRYSTTVYGRWALRDLERGVGVRQAQPEQQQQQ